jgi:hypothetical protein
MPCVIAFLPTKLGWAHLSERAAAVAVSSARCGVVQPCDYYGKSVILLVEQQSRLGARLMQFNPRTVTQHASKEAHGRCVSWGGGTRGSGGPGRPPAREYASVMTWRTRTLRPASFSAKPSSVPPHSIFAVRSYLDSQRLCLWVSLVGICFSVLVGFFFSSIRLGMPG